MTLYVSIYMLSFWIVYIYTQEYVSHNSDTLKSPSRHTYCSVETVTYLCSQVDIWIWKQKLFMGIVERYFFS